MKEFGKATGEAWEQSKETTDKMWADFKTGLTNAQSKPKSHMNSAPEGAEPCTPPKPASAGFFTDRRLLVVRLA
jgi:hypothetical protein